MHSAGQVKSLVDIKGQWDVASFEGSKPKHLSGPIRATQADFHNRGVALRIECNYSGAAGTVTAGRFVATPNQDIVSTQMSCGPELDSRDGRYFTFFHQSPTIERLGDGRLRLVSGKTELILDRPDKHRLADLPAPSDIQGKWRLMQLNHDHPEGGYSGIGLSEIPGRLSITADKITYEPCPQFALTYRLSTDARLMKTGGKAPSGVKDCPALDKPHQASTLPHEPEAVLILHANPLADRPEKDQLVLTAGEYALYLVRSR